VKLIELEPGDRLQAIAPVISEEGEGSGELPLLGGSAGA
jgi:hypothetical protein